MAERMLAYFFFFHFTFFRALYFFFFSSIFIFNFHFAFFGEFFFPLKFEWHSPRRCLPGNSCQCNTVCFCSFAFFFLISFSSMIIPDHDRMGRVSLRSW
jgi:hypothetical protein